VLSLSLDMRRIEKESKQG